MMETIAILYEGNKSLLDNNLISHLTGKVELYGVDDKNEFIAYKKLKQFMKMGLIAGVFFIVNTDADADYTQQKIAKITHELGIEPQIIKPNETVVKKVPQFGFAKGTFIMADNFDEPLEEFKDYM